MRCLSETCNVCDSLQHKKLPEGAHKLGNEAKFTISNEDCELQMSLVHNGFV